MYPFSQVTVGVIHPFFFVKQPVKNLPQSVSLAAVVLSSHTLSLHLPPTPYEQSTVPFTPLKVRHVVALPVNVVQGELLSTQLLTPS